MDPANVSDPPLRLVPVAAGHYRPVHRPLAQIELAALGVAMLSLPLVLGGGAAGLPLGAFAMLAGVQVSMHMRALRELRGSRPDAVPLAPGERVARATRTLSHAAMMIALTYVLVAQTNRSAVGAIVLLAAGGAAALLSLVQARLILRDRPADVFAVPKPAVLAERLGVALPRWVEGAPIIELLVLLFAVPGYAALPWSLLATVAIARLWRWYVGPGLLEGHTPSA